MAFGFLMVYVAVLLVRPQEWYQPLAGLQLVNIAAVLTLLTTFLSQEPGRPIFPALTRSGYARLVWAVLATIVISNLAFFRVRGAVNAFTGFGKVCVLFFLTMMLVDNQKRTRKMMWLMMLSAAILCLHGFQQINTGQGFGGVMPYGSFETGDFRVRGTGSFHDPNDFAILFILAVPFLLTLVRTTGIVPAKLLLLAALPPMMVVLFHTHSRGGLIGFCAMLASYAWLSTRSKFIRLFLIAALLAGTVAFGPARARGTYMEGSARQRTMFWGTCISKLKENPLLGVGDGKLYLYTGGKAAHSSYAQVFGEMGLIGYIPWFALFWCVLRGLYRIARTKTWSQRNIPKLATGLFAALMGYQSSALFLSRMHNPELFFLTGLGVGFIHYVQRQPEAPPGFLEVNAREFRIAAVAALVSIPTLWVMIRAYSAMSGEG